MSYKELYSLHSDFQKSSKERQTELIKTNACNLSIKFIGGGISFYQLKECIGFLSELGIISKQDLMEFIQSRAGYECPEQAHVKTEAEREIRNNRFIKIRDELE